MIYCNNKYPVLLNDEYVFNMEKTLHMRCLYGGFVGSHVYGTANKFSDYDFAFVFSDDTDERNMIKYKDEKLIEWNGFNIQEIRTRINFCKKEVKIFPSFYTEYRCTPNEDIVPDFLVFTSDYVWDSGYLWKNYKDIITNCGAKLILDYYFNRAAGNLEKNLCRDQVPTKRIIQTILGINCMYWILDYHTFPYLSFYDMTKLFHCKNEQRLIFQVLQYHQQDHKNKNDLVLPYNKQLNEYIFTCLKNIEYRILKEVDDSFSFGLDDNSFLGKVFKYVNS